MVLAFLAAQTPVPGGLGSNLCHLLAVNIWGIIYLVCVGPLPMENRVTKGPALPGCGENWWACARDTKNSAWHAEGTTQVLVFITLITVILFYCIVSLLFQTVACWRLIITSIMVLLSPPSPWLRWGLLKVKPQECSAHRPAWRCVRGTPDPWEYFSLKAQGGVAGGECRQLYLNNNKISKKK